MKPRFTIGAFALIGDPNGQVLLCRRRDTGAWNLPGGVVEHSESPWQAVIREVDEETGLQVVVNRLHGVYAKPDKDEIVFSFECEIVGGSITTSEEADRIEYFTPDDLPSSLLKKQRERILDWVAANPRTHLKEQFSSMEGAGT